MWKPSTPFVALPLLLSIGCQNASPPRPPSVVVPPAAGRESTRSDPSPLPAQTTAPEPSAAPPPAPAWPPLPPSGVTTDFCIELVNALDEETCYVLPDAPTTELVLYLHGIIPPMKTSVQKTNVETVVANAARRASVAALMPRGRRGLAPKGQEDWLGWPTTGDSYARLADELVASFAAKREKLEALTGARFTRVYVAGSSSGAYFVAALALNGGIEADGFGVLSGGAFTARARPEELAPKPFYIGYGSYDTVGSDARVLANRLRSAGWPVKLSVHPVAHGAKEIYLDEAFAFFRETNAPRAPEGYAPGPRENETPRKP